MLAFEFKLFFLQTASFQEHSFSKIRKLTSHSLLYTHQRQPSLEGAAATAGKVSWAPPGCPSTPASQQHPETLEDCSAYLEYAAPCHTPKGPPSPVQQVCSRGGPSTVSHCVARSVPLEGGPSQTRAK